MPYYPTRRVTVIARDPSVQVRGAIVRASVEVPNEELQAGPRGYRVQVVDFDSSTGILYKTLIDPPNRSDGPPPDPFERSSDEELLASPDFHALNCYAIVMRTLARFEFALGRRVAWSFPGHQMKVAPHAFANANAFYSSADEALLFGYFRHPHGSRHVFGCLAHDIIAHETTHALLDGLRARYTDPSSPEQAGFHEGFADLVALLSIFALREVVARVLDPASANADRISASAVTPAALRQSILLGLGQEFGQELSGIRGNPLRRSVELKPEQAAKHGDEPHHRGEVLVAAVMDAFLNVWVRRLGPYIHQGRLDRGRTVEEGAAVAGRLLTICIRALDYCPPTDLQFCDFASALLTADWEMYPRDAKYFFRDELRASLHRYGIPPASAGAQEPGARDPPPEKPAYDRTHFEQMQRNPDELFRFLWENRRLFKLHENAYTRVLSVRPCLRTGADGFALRETVVEYVQLIRIRAAELKTLGIRRPSGMPTRQELTLYGGNAMIFDQFGRLKYNVGNSLFNAGRQQARLNYLWDCGFFSRAAVPPSRFASAHRRRMLEFR
jgi:hypothetical protein